MLGVPGCPPPAKLGEVAERSEVGGGNSQQGLNQGGLMSDVRCPEIEELVWF